MPNISAPNLRLSTAVFLGVPRPFRLEAEVAASRMRSFQQRYQRLTGVMPTVGHRHGLLSVTGNKWGAETRVYFNAADPVVVALRSLGFHIEEGRTYNPKFQYRINTKEIWWALVEAGYRLGNNR